MVVLEPLARYRRVPMVGAIRLERAYRRGDDVVWLFEALLRVL